MTQNDISAWQRWIAPMPTFFKVIFYICMAIALANAAFIAIDMQLLTFDIERPVWFSKVLGYLATGAAIVAKFTVDYKKWQDDQALVGFGENQKPLSFKSMDDYLDPNIRNVSKVKNQLPVPPPRSPLSEVVTYSSLTSLTKNELTQKLAFWRKESSNCKFNDATYRRYQSNINIIETRMFDIDRMNSKDLNKKS